VYGFLIFVTEETLGIRTESSFLHIFLYWCEIVDHSP
jgi:hypothetical protein